MSEIELIITDCPWQTKAYEFGISMLLSHYKIKVDKLTSEIEVDDFLVDIKFNHCVNLGCKEGNKFIGYCNKLMYKFNIEESDTKDELLELRDKIFNTYKDLVTVCDKKLADITAKEPKDNDPTNEKIMGTFKYLTESYQRYDLLIRYLSEDRGECDTSFYWFIYQELLNNFKDCNNDIAIAKSKLIQAFHARTSQDKSFQTLYDIFNEPSESNTDSVSQNLANDETVQAVAIDRINIATIDELEKSIVTFCYSRNDNFYDAFIKRFFTLKPTIDKILDFEYELLSVKSFLTDHAKLLELFYSNATYAIKELAEADEIKMSEIHNYFAIANKPACIESKKTLIQFLASTH